jgi:hypothetical protein
VHLHSSDHHVYLSTDTRGATCARVEWVFVMASATPQQDVHAECAARKPLEAVRFCADAAQLRDAANAMLACVNVLEAIDACAAPLAPTPACGCPESIVSIEEDAPEG